MADEAISKPYFSRKTYLKIYILHVIYQLYLGPILGLILMIFKGKIYAINLGFIYAPTSKLNASFMVTTMQWVVLIGIYTLVFIYDPQPDEHFHDPHQNQKWIFFLTI